MKKRTRWTVTMRHHSGVGTERQVVLAYSAAQAQEHYERQGCTVLSVSKGDYRQRHITARPTENWSFNLSAIHAAFEAMTGSRLPDGLRIVKGRATRNQKGLFEVSVIGGLEVRIARNATAADANQTLWHELAHVAQYVRHLAAGGDTVSYVRHLNTANRDGTGYKNRPHEREAREWEHLAETDWLLNGARR